MKVSIDCRYIRERPSGIGAYNQALVDRLPELAPEDSFHFWAHPHAAGKLAIKPRTSETVVRSAANGPGTLFWPAHLVDLSGVDVLHAPFNLLGRGIRVPTVVTVHDLIWLLHPSQAEGLGPMTPVQALFYRSGILRALRHATRLIAISRATADSIARFFPSARSRVQVIHHGVDPDFVPPGDRDAVRARLRERFGVERYFLVIGQNSPSKNHAAVLEAFAAAALDPSITLLFVQRLYTTRGRPLTLGEPLDVRAERLGVTDRVRFVSGLTRTEIVELYQGALGLVQFSRHEGFGMPVLEAMACGTPVIASDIAPLVEVLAGAALHAPLEPRALGRELRRLATEPNLEADLRERGLARSRDFSWDRSARDHLEVYRDAAR